MKNWVTKYYWWLFAGAVVLLGFLCFWQLGNFAVYAWDEARHGVNALEMMQNGDMLANYYNGELDYWNLKPPLSYYGVMLGYCLFGYNGFGLRFFSGVAYLTLAVLSALYLKRRLPANGRIASLLAVLMFAGSYVYFFFHGVRAGDGDSLFMLLLGVGFISLLLSSDNANWLHLTGGSLALAFLTKSFHALILLPIIAVYLLATKGWKHIKWWQYLTVTLVTLTPVAIWAGFRLAFDGWKFLYEMLYTDVLARSANSVEGHLGFPFFYTVSILENVPNVISLVLLVYSIVVHGRQKTPWTNLEKLVVISLVCFLGVYGIARTKLNWYIYPLATPLILFGATKFSEVLDNLNFIKVGKILIWIGVIGSVLTTLVWVVVPADVNQLYTVSADDRELQTLVHRLPVEVGAVYFYQNGGITQLGQDALCTFEWRTKKRVTAGGVESYNQHYGPAYIIVKQTDQALVGTVVDSTTNYAVYYHQ